MKNIETKILDAINEIKDLYQNDGQSDSEMSDLACGQIQSYRQVLDWFQEERIEKEEESSLGQIEADVSIDEINEAFEEAKLEDDDAGYQAQKEEGNIKEGEI